MQLFSSAVGITLALLQVTLHVATDVPKDTSASLASNATAGPLGLSAPDPVPSPDLEATPDSEATPASLGSADNSTTALPDDVTQLSTPLGVKPAPIPGQSTHALPGSSIDPAIAGPKPSFVPGDTSSGKCMCPPPPSCSPNHPLHPAGPNATIASASDHLPIPDADNSTAVTALDNPSIPSTQSSHATSDPSPPIGSVGSNDTTSAASAMNGRPIILSMALAIAVVVY